MFPDDLLRPAPPRKTDNWNGLLSLLTVGGTVYLSNQHHLAGLLQKDVLVNTVVFCGLNEIVREGCNAVSRVILPKKSDYTAFAVGTVLGAAVLTSSFSKIEKQVKPIMQTSKTITDAFLSNAEKLLTGSYHWGQASRRSLENTPYYKR